MFIRNDTAISEREDRLFRVFRKYFAHYDTTAVNSLTYRKQAIQILNLKSGDTVIDLGCGTGLNFSLLQQVVGSKGKIIGVEGVKAIVDQAWQRVRAEGWSNVELIQSKSVSFQYPTKVDGIISTFVVPLLYQWERISQNGCNALAPGKRWVVLDLKSPANEFSQVPSPLIFLFDRFLRKTTDREDRNAWVPISSYLQNTLLSKLYTGFVYVAPEKRRLDE